MPSWWITVMSFVTVAALIALLMSRKFVPTLILIAVPVISGLLCGFSMAELTDYALSGISSMTKTMTMIMFAITFFSTMMDNGVFDVIVNFLLKRMKLNVFSVMILVFLVTVVTSLDGSCVTTYIITFSMMRPLFKQFKIRESTLLAMVVMISGIMNMVPWGGPTMRLATVVGMDVVEFYMQALPVQIFGLVVCFGVVLFMAYREVKLGAGLSEGEVVELGEHQVEDRSQGNKPKFIVNCILIVAAVFFMLKSDFIPNAGMVLMLATVIAFIINYPKMDTQRKKLIEFSPSILGIAFTLMGAGVMTGILKNTNMINQMGLTLAGLLPDMLGRYAHLIVAALSVPFLMCLDVDTYCYGILPVFIEVCGAFGVSALGVATAFLLTSGCAAIQPYTASTWVAIDCMDTDLKNYWKHCNKFLWGVLILMLIFGLIIGVNVW
ncbi:MAG: hypothetical protein IKO22_07180 [Oscillospiraceae bacterium]|nr:hypothetical protein [Oscillospiraceae bacterium]